MQQQVNIRKVLKVAARIALVVAIVALLRLYVFEHYVDRVRMQEFIDGLGLYAPLGFLGIVILTAIFYLPSALVVGVGAVVLGVTMGPILSIIGLTIGDCISFLLGRYLFRDYAARLIRGKMSKLNEWAAASSVGFIFGLRLMFYSNTALNYAVGLTSVGFRDYALGTFVGMIPRTYVISLGFELIWEAKTIQQMILNPYLLALPLLQVLGGILIMILVKRDKRKRESAKGVNTEPSEDLLPVLRADK